MNDQTQETVPEADDDRGGKPGEARVNEPYRLRDELANQRSQYIRLAADFDNFKRRSLQETEVRAASQKESLIHELLPIIDNLERALACKEVPGSRQLRLGVEMTLRQLHLLLGRHGVEADAGVGQPFDPHRHEAISQRRDPALPDQSVVEVFQRGYSRGKKVLRPAKVGINNLE